VSIHVKDVELMVQVQEFTENSALAVVRDGEFTIQDTQREGVDQFTGDPRPVARRDYELSYTRSIIHF
jgi:hypothetical protein